MGRVSALALLLASACGDSNTTTAGGGGTDSSSGTDSTGSTTGTSFPTSGGQTESSSPTTSGASNSASEATTDATVTATGTATTTNTSGPDTDSGPGTTTSSTSETTAGTTDSDTTDSSTTGDTTDTTIGVDTTTDTDGTSDSSTTDPDTTTGEEPCGSVLKATIRDFRFDHPDFEAYGGNAAYTGLVQVDLGPDNKPVYAHPGATPQTTGPEWFQHWYNDTPGTNQTFAVNLPLMEVMPGLYQFADNTFFPIDNLGWGNEGQPNNFAFTTEIHTTFVYNGGELFTFTGDDDVWVFINGKLALDLGGLHPQLSDTVDLDADAAFLGITPGQTYTMDIFHAERHTGESNFRIDTTIACFVPM